jgi:hypothetical protein
MASAYVIMEDEGTGGNKMAQPQVYEGTAQEIAEQLRVNNLSGRLKAIVMPEETGKPEMNGTDVTLDKALAALIVEADSVEREVPAPHEIAFGEIFTEKYRKMGFKL